MNNNAIKDLNATFFNALNYEKYISKKNYFNSINNLIEKEEKYHQKELEDFQKGLKTNNPAKFEKYLLKKLKDNLKETFEQDLNKIKKIEIEKDIDEQIENTPKFKEQPNNKQDLQDIKLILSYTAQNIEKCKFNNESNFSNFKFYLFALLITSKNDAENEVKKIIGNNLDNLKKIFYIDYKRQLGEAPVYKEIKNIANIKLNIFKREITEKIKDIKMKILEYNVPKVFEESIETIIKCLTDLKSKIEIDLKSQKKK